MGTFHIRPLTAPEGQGLRAKMDGFPWHIDQRPPVSQQVQPDDGGVLDIGQPKLLEGCCVSCLHRQQALP